jgi:hypothetical protein
MESRFANYPRRRLVLIGGGLALIALAVAGGMAFAGGPGSSDVYVPRLGIPLPAEKAAAFDRPAPTEKPVPQPIQSPPAYADGIPAKVLGPDAPVPVSPTVIRTTNSWLTSDGKTLVAVYAGSAGDDESQGRVVVVRQDLAAGVQTEDVVDSGPTGALTIVEAPSGAAVETSAQRGKIALKGRRGADATLNLQDDSLQMRPSG